MNPSLNLRKPHWPRHIAALFVGVWIFAAAIPCVMAMDTACDEPCAPTNEACGLAAVGCEQMDSSTLPALPVAAPSRTLGVLPLASGTPPETVRRVQYRQRISLDLPRHRYAHELIRLLT